MVINVNSAIPIDNSLFQSYIESFVINCPSATVISKKKDKSKTYNNVSARNCSFRDRGITGTLLTTVTSQIKKYMRNGLFKKASNKERVEVEFDIDNSSEKIVFCENTQMSDAEVVFYYIRNAFAHGDFEYLPSNGMYKLESKKKDVVKAQMLLSETTLNRLSGLLRLDKSKIMSLQKRRRSTHS